MDGPYVVSVVAEHVPLLEVWVPEYPHHGDPVLLLSLVGETLRQLVGGGSCQQTCRQYLMKFRHQKHETAHICPKKIHKIKNLWAKVGKKLLKLKVNRYTGGWLAKF